MGGEAFSAAPASSISTAVPVTSESASVGQASTQRWQLAQSSSPARGCRLGPQAALDRSKGRRRSPSSTALDHLGAAAPAKDPPGGHPSVLSAMRILLRPCVPRPAAIARDLSGNREFAKRRHRFEGARGKPSATMSRAVSEAQTASLSRISRYQLPRAKRPIRATGRPGTGSGSLGRACRAFCAPRALGAPEISDVGSTSGAYLSATTSMAPADSRP